MWDVLELSVRLSPARAAELVIGGASPRTIELRERAADRVVDALHLLLAATDRGGARPSAVRLRPREKQVMLERDGSWQPVADEVIARLPALALAGPVAIARREAGDTDAEAEAGAMAGDAAFWAARYQENDIGWDLGEAAPPLARVFRTLKKGRAVVVGCGQGHEVRALAKLGFEAVGVDFAAEAIERAQRLTAEAGLSARFEQADALALPTTLAGFDYWIEHTCFCAIDPARRDDYVQSAARALAPQGELVGLFYAHGRPGGPPFTTTEAELRRRFEPAFVIDSLEVPPDSIARRKGEELLGRFRRK